MTVDPPSPYPHARRIFGHPAVLLGGGRALLLQVAHPLVARAVLDHSDFERDPFGRLARTLEVVNAIVYGDGATAAAAEAGLAEVHRRVTGPGYAASDPALAGWVHATLIDTTLRMHARFVAPLPPDVADAFYAEAVQLGVRFGVPVAAQPPDRTAFRRYVRATIGELAPRILSLIHI